MSKETNLFVEEDVSMDESETDLNVESDPKERQQPPKHRGRSNEEQEIDDDEDDDENKPEHSNDDDDDDPVIESIPVHMNTVPDRIKQSLHLLQYLGKPKGTGTAQNLSHLSASVKPQSGFIQVKLPLDTSRFYDESKAEHWGVEVVEHNHMGVMNKTNGGLYAAKFVVDNQQQKQVVLIPIDTTSQLRPSFKYLDDIEILRSKRELGPDPHTKSTTPHNVHILQSNAKNSKNNTNDTLATTSLGESLKHIRRFDQEEWCDMEWCDMNGNEVNSRQLYDKITSVSDRELETKDSIMDYLNVLTRN